MTSHDWTAPENLLRSQQLEMLLAIVEDAFEPGKTMLDLGYGSGLVESMIFERMPHAQIVGIENSEAMMALAAERLKPYPFHFIPVRYDLTELSSILGPASPLPRQHYQIVFSVQTLHRLTPEQLQGTYLTVYDILDPGGLFLLLDRVTVTTPGLWSAYRSLWRLLESQPDAKLNEGETYAEYLQRLTERGDFPISLEDHLRWLQNAGFEAACLHLHTDHALIAARKT